MRTMKISKRETILIVFVIFAISAAAYYFYYLVPTMATIEETALSIEDKQIQVLSMQSQIQQIDIINQEIEDLQQQIAEDTSDIPVGVSQPLQLVEITRILNDKTDYPSISFAQAVNTYETYQINIADIAYVTTYENLLQILNEFKQLSMTNQIVDMSVSYTEDPLTYYTAVLDGYYLAVQMSIKFYSFYKTPSTEPLGQQPFEDSPVEYKNPFKMTLN